MCINGEMSFNVSVETESVQEKSALLEANLKYHPELVIAWELIAVDCNGDRHKIRVNEVNKVRLDVVI